VWFVRLLVILVVNVAVIFFVVANLGGPPVTLHWWNPNSPGTQVNLMVALLVAYVLGFLTFFVVSAVREMRLRRKCSRLSRQVVKMREELDALRMAPLETAAPARQTPIDGQQA